MAAMPTALLALHASVNAVGLCGLLVWTYNRTFSGLHESLLKKAVALLTLPVGIGAGLAAALAWGTPVGLWICPACWGLALATLAASARQRRAERADARFARVEPIPPAPGATIAWEALGPIERAVLAAASPLNRPTALVVKTYRLEVDGLAASEPIRIVHASDFHIHRTLREEYYREVVRVVNALEPDVILLGGDYVTKERHVGRIAGILAGLRAPQGVFAIRGNHDFWTRPRAVGEQLRRAGITLLSQDGVEVRVRGAALRVAGIESPYLPLAPRQLRRLRAVSPHVALVHTPDAFPAAAAIGARVAIAGHTHGGQVRLPWFGTTLSGTRLGPGHALGMNSVGGMRTLVSAGVGSFVPLRVNCPPEVLLLLVSGGGHLADRLSDKPDEPAGEGHEDGPLRVGHREADGDEDDKDEQPEDHHRDGDAIARVSGRRGRGRGR